MSYAQKVTLKSIPKSPPMPRIKVEEVINITRSKASPHKIGSRGIPHRLTQKERIIFERACREGVLRVPLTGTRENLKNAYWLYCQTQGKEYIEDSTP